MSTTDPVHAAPLRRGLRTVMAAIAGIACSACFLPSLLTLGVFGAIGSAVNGAWVAAGIVAATVLLVTAMRHRARTDGPTCETGCGCSTDAPRDPAEVTPI